MTIFFLLQHYPSCYPVFVRVYQVMVDHHSFVHHCICSFTGHISSSYNIISYNIPPSIVCSLVGQKISPLLFWLGFSQFSPSLTSVGLSKLPNYKRQRVLSVLYIPVSLLSLPYLLFGDSIVLSLFPSLITPVIFVSYDSDL